MDTKEWGNNAPERLTAQRCQINYTKLFWVIVGAILMAFTIMSLVSLLFARAAIYSFEKSLSQAFGSPKLSQPVYTPPPQPQSQHHLTLRQAVTPTQPKPKSQKEDFERAAILTCQFWRDQYEKDGLEASKKNRDRTCASIK